MTRALVAFFSATGTTARAAKALAQTADADLFEIRPATPYSAADLNWNNKRSRSSVEMDDESARPELADAGSVDGYDTIFVGFPVWWYVEPRIIDTFLEARGCSGKTIVPFVTSGGSGLGRAPQRFRSICPGATVKDGKRLSAGESAASLAGWMHELGL